MPYATNQGVRIHYQVEGHGPALVLQHGFASRLEAWRQLGYVEALRRDYQCILLDARGHGDSDKPRDPAAYAMRRRVEDVVAVLDALGLRKAHFFGYSMGGWMGFGMAMYAGERLNALMIGGAHPYADRSWDAFQGVDGTDPDAFASALETVVGERFPPEVRALVLANDLQALAAAAQERPSLDDGPSRMTMPSLLMVGDADARYSAVQECAKRMPDATFVALPGCNHVTGFVRSDLVLPHVTQFLSTVTS
jgi:pimeloyl-ACP methyl ester carboxylesterase